MCAARDTGGMTLGAAGDAEGGSGEEEGREEGEGDHDDCKEGHCSLAIEGRLEASVLRGCSTAGSHGRVMFLWFERLSEGDETLATSQRPVRQAWSPPSVSHLKTYVGRRQFWLTSAARLRGSHAMNGWGACT
jgi:hypothetical protein